MSRPSKEPIVLIPGLLCSTRLYASQLAMLQGRGQPGEVADHTGSDRMSGIAQTILASAPARFALAGLSMGGYIAMEIMRAAPGRVSRVAFLDTTANPDPPERAADRRKLVEIARAEGVRKVQGLLLPRLIHPARMGEAALTETVLAMAEDVGFAAFERQQEAIISRADSRPSLGAIRCPVLVLVGQQDLQTPPDVAREMAMAIPGARLEIVPDCGHLSTLERPEAVNMALQAWLDA